MARKKTVKKPKKTINKLEVTSITDNADGTASIVFEMTDDMADLFVKHGIKTSLVETAKKTIFNDTPNTDQTIKALVDAIYPILIPMEEQDMAIQAKNYELIKGLATLVYTEFITESLK